MPKLLEFSFKRVLQSLIAVIASHQTTDISVKVLLKYLIPKCLCAE